MALRRRDVIVASVVAFFAWAFITHLLPATRFLPYAFLAGVAFTIAVCGWVLLTVSRRPYTYNEADLYGSVHVAFVKPQIWATEKKALSARSEYLREPLYAPSFVISGMIDGLIDLILRDFVRSWYDRISSQPAFTIEVDRAIRAALANILERVLAVDLVELTTSRFVPIITQHLRDFYEAERVVKGKRLSRNVTESDELDLAIAGKYKDGNLHPAASLAFSNLKSIQQQHLRSIVMRLLPQILPKSMTSSPAVTVLIKEIVSCAVLYPITQMLSDPDTWNQLIENYVRNLTKPNRVSLAS
jgi:sorting nexin-25